MHGGFRIGLSIVLIMAMLLPPFSGSSAHACATMHGAALPAEHTHHMSAAAGSTAAPGSEHASLEAICECCQDCAGSGCSLGGHGAVTSGATSQGRDTVHVWRATPAGLASDLTFPPLTPPPRSLPV